MFDLDTWQEILDTIKANKLRSFLTAFSVAWGIFMLIVLLGSGEGLANGIEYQFRDDAINSIWVYPGQTSIPYKGLAPGRNLQLTNEDRNEIRANVGGVDHITSRFYIGGNLRVRYREETTTFDVRSVHPDHLFVEKTIITRGAIPQRARPLGVPQGRRDRRAGQGCAVQEGTGAREVHRDQRCRLQGGRALHRRGRRGRAGEDLPSDHDRATRVRRCEPRRA